jgi:hypothetical protein
VGGPNTIPMSSVKRGKVSSNSTTVKLLSLRDPINPICVSTQLNVCCNRAQPMRSLIDTGGGYHLGAPNLTSDHSHPSHPVFPTFPQFSARSHIKSLADHYHKPDRTTIMRTGPIVSGYQPLVFYRWPIILSIAILML